MDKRLNKLRINLPKNWLDVSTDNPDGPPTFMRGDLDAPGVLQISIAEYLSGAVPNPGKNDLITLSKNIGVKNDFGVLMREEAGTCAYGTFGLAEFSGAEFPFITIWHISDGRNFIFATFICEQIPGEQELNEVVTILTTIKKKSLFNSMFN